MTVHGFDELGISGELILNSPIPHPSLLICIAYILKITAELRSHRFLAVIGRITDYFVNLFMSLKKPAYCFSVLYAVYEREKGGCWITLDTCFKALRALSHQNYALFKSDLSPVIVRLE